MLSMAVARPLSMWSLRMPLLHLTSTACAARHARGFLKPSAHAHHITSLLAWPPVRLSSLYVHTHQCYEQRQSKSYIPVQLRQVVELCCLFPKVDSNAVSM